MTTNALFSFVEEMCAAASRWVAAASTPARRTTATLGPRCSEGLLLVLLFFAVVPLSLLQLAALLFGALCFLFVRSAHPLLSVHFKPSKLSKKRAVEVVSDSDDSPPTLDTGQAAPLRKPRLPRPMSETEGHILASAPVKPRGQVFASRGWEEDVAALVQELMPTPESAQMLRHMSSLVKAGIEAVFPDAVVEGFASGDFGRGSVFGSSAPDIDIVISGTKTMLAKRLQEQCGKNNPAFADQLNPEKLYKAVLRECTEHLVQNGFKFRRSLFRCFEPKVTMLPPPCVFALDEQQAENYVPIDLSINAAVPRYFDALFTACGMEPRAKELILFVRRWAKDRNLCFAPKGYLMPYQWSLLAIYFLQVRVAGEGPLLPAFNVFESPAGCFRVAACDDASWTAPTLRPGGGGGVQAASPTSIAALVEEFACFYNSDFDFCNEVVSIRAGRRMALSECRLSRHVIFHDDGVQTAVAPTIEDPFNVLRTIRTPVTWESLARMRQELVRCEELCTSAASLRGGGATLAQLLQPYELSEAERHWRRPDKSPSRPSDGENDECTTTERGIASKQEGACKKSQRPQLRGREQQQHRRDQCLRQ